MKDEKIKYFWIVVLIAGSAGIWLPLVIALFSGTDIHSKDVPPNLTTYFLSVLVGGCVDYGLTLFKNPHDRSRNEFLKVILILIVTFVLLLFCVMSSVFDHLIWAYIFSIGGTLLALRIWWNVNIENRIINSSAALGGDII